MRKLLDEDNAQLMAVVAELLSQDVDITLREIARQHPTICNASAFTRNAQRTQIVKDAIARQVAARAVAAAPHKRKAESLAEQLARREEEIAKLKSQVQTLVASHAACVRAVLLHGGMPALERFWADYKSIGEEVLALHALPAGADIIDLPVRNRRQTK